MEIGDTIDWGVTILILIDGFLQFKIYLPNEQVDTCHNPYFNRWFSAIKTMSCFLMVLFVTILILIDGFLQSVDKVKTY